MSTTATDLAGKVAVVTGGSSGLGAAIASALEDAGAKVLVADLLGSPPVDVTSEADVRSVFASLDRLDDVRIGIENAQAVVHADAQIRRAARPPSSGSTVPLI